MNNEIPAGVVAKVRQAVEANVHYVPIFREMAERAQKRTVIDLYRMRLGMVRGGVSYTDLDFMKLFELMERAGVGKMTVREQPNHSTFEFKYTMQNLARTVLQGLSRSAMGDAGVLARGTVKNAPSELVAIVELNGGPLTIKLPRSFNSKDAKTLCDRLVALAKLNESGQL
jgi:hypothetical protein